MTADAPDRLVGQFKASGEEHWNEAKAAAAQSSVAAGSELEWLGGFGGFVLAAIFVVAAAIMVTIGSQDLHKTRNWVEHTNAVLLMAGNAREALLAAEIARRGYVITGNRSYLSRYAREVTQTSKDIDKLAELVSDNPVQKSRVAVLKAWVAQVWAQDDAEIRNSTPARLAEAMRRDIASGNDIHVSDKSAAELDMLRSLETNLLAARERETDSAQVWLLTFAALSMIFSLVAVGAGVFLMQRQIAAARTRELQLELAHMQRLGLMNQTSSVLAHEIKQPLTAALNYFRAFLHLTEDGKADRAKTREIAIKVEKQILRAADIVGRLRSFIDRNENERKLESPTVLVGDAVELLGTIDSSVVLETRVTPGLPPVLVDRVQAQQVLVNLLRNAIEALEGREYRKLVLTASVCGVNEVEFCLEDNGKGLSRDMMQRLFSSFVTTKRNGMGLGLSICRSIVTAHGGRIWAEPSNEGGAAFHFTFPIEADE